MKKVKIFGINGSASKNSTNITILNKIGEFGKSEFELKIIEDLSNLHIFKLN